MTLVRSLLLFCTCCTAWAQLGDVPNDAPQVPHAAGDLPPPRPLTPAEQLKTFRLPPGFKIELLADESLVRDPAAITFDLQGNLWVAEMSGFNAEMVKFLPELSDGHTELPPGKIVRLESSRRDGVYDRRVVVVDDLHAPRALAILRDGVLFADPPYLWLARDLDGDGKIDEKVVVSDRFGRKGDDEASANGLIWGRDNVIQTIAHDANFRYENGAWTEIPVPVRGQFGLTQDDFGRLYFTRNSDHLRGDLYSPHYGMRNPWVTNLPWFNFNVAEDQTIWPGHPTPSANRGYRRGIPGTVNGGLRPDGSMLEFSAACGSVLYRGTNFPESFYNNAFVPDVIGNLVKRSIPLETEGRVFVMNAYAEREFLTSTDERFRPVAVANAPDGSLIVVDMYRGLIEQYNFISSYSKDQILKRRLNSPLFGTGRLWRVTYEGGNLEKRQPDLLKASGPELVEALEHPNAWWRDTAQQAIVERKDRSAIPALQRLLETSPKEVTRIYALWTLDGLNAVSDVLLDRTLRDPSAKVRSASVRIHEKALRQLGASEAAALERLAFLVKDPAPEVAVQLALSLGEAKSPRVLELLHAILDRHGAHPYIPKAIASSLGRREWEFLHVMAPHFPERFVAEKATLLTVLSEAVIRRGEKSEKADWIRLVSDQGQAPSWVRVAVIKGFAVSTTPALRRTLGPDRIVTANDLAQLVASSDATVAQEAKQVSDKLQELEIAASVKKPISGPLTPAQALVAERGKSMYALCAGCHQANGEGLPGAFPSLVTSPWTVGKPENLLRIMLNGKEGTPGYPGGMPPVRSLTDDHIAAIATYVRNAWGLSAGAVDTEMVARIRQETLSRQAAWTDTELKQLP